MDWERTAFCLFAETNLQQKKREEEKNTKIWMENFSSGDSGKSMEHKGCQLTWKCAQNSIKQSVIVTKEKPKKKEKIKKWYKEKFRQLTKLRGHS